MSRDLERLIDVVEELAGELGALGERHWALWMSESARLLRDDPAGGARHLLEAYGGMGSFNDALPELVDEAPDGRAVRARELREKAWTLARDVAPPGKGPDGTR